MDLNLEIYLIMKRKTFLKSLLGLVVAPMALAKNVQNKPIIKNRIPQKSYDVVYGNNLHSNQWSEFHEGIEFLYGDQWPESVLRTIKERQDKINKLHFNIIQGIKS